MPDKSDSSALRVVRGVANYQFGPKIGRVLFPEDLTITKSPRTRRIRHIYVENELVATLRPTDGYLALTLAGAKRIKKYAPKPRFRVVVESEVARFISEGRNVFSKHVVEADPEIRPSAEVIVVDERDAILAVGKALLNGEEMIAFERGVAVKVRKGIKEGEQNKEENATSGYGKSYA
ncbi:MAG: PUA domain-containing protein [Candidatus Hodarchaeota archaeon]